ncbi:Ceramide kinase [Capsicum baccatum]|uniref:Ceramide kinase n=1 Tax=Capsicum baccatum TaxID=33114 RepID=A0A2G2WU22_CAPBA|nr:Ceramide kinase [Capsicum baccatum]
MQTVSWELLFNLVVIGFNLLTVLPDICKLNLDNSALKVDMFIVYIFQFVLFLSSLYSFRQGGDGFFNEILNGLLLSRHKCSYPPSPTELNHPIENNGSGLVLETNVDIRDPSDSGEDESPLLKQSTNLRTGEDSCQTAAEDLRFSFPNEKFRFGLIPAGSTDAVVICTTGARDAMTSALQTVLGKSVCLDIAQVVRWKKTSISKDEPSVRYAASFAGYGFYGDVITESEKYRWMGPKRYDYAGTKVFLSHRSYEAEVAYVEVESEKKNTGLDKASGGWTKGLWSLLKKSERVACRANCNICKTKAGHTSAKCPRIRPATIPTPPNEPAYKLPLFQPLLGQPRVLVRQTVAEIRNYEIIRVFPGLMSPYDLNFLVVLCVLCMILDSKFADSWQFGSISFGRFENEVLCWERRSSFTQNRYLKEVEKCIKPGSVTEKRAYFEELFRRRVLLSQSSSDCQDGADSQASNDVSKNTDYEGDFEHVNEIGHSSCFVENHDRAATLLENGKYQASENEGYAGRLEHVNKVGHSACFDENYDSSTHLSKNGKYQADNTGYGGDSERVNEITFFIKVTSSSKADVLNQHKSTEEQLIARKVVASRASCTERVSHRLYQSVNRDKGSVNSRQPVVKQNGSSFRFKTEERARKRKEARANFLCLLDKVQTSYKT